MTGLIIIADVLFLFAWILVAPFALRIDSEAKSIKVFLRGLFSLEVHMRNEEIEMSIWILFFHLRINNFKRRSKKNKSHLKNEDKPEKEKKGTDKIQLIKRVLLSFKIKKLNAKIDTGDYPLNAQLIPFTSAMQTENIKVDINFENENSLYLEVYNRLINMIIITLQEYINNK